VCKRISIKGAGQRLAGRWSRGANLGGRPTLPGRMLMNGIISEGQGFQREKQKLSCWRGCVKLLRRKPVVAEDGANSVEGGRGG